MPHAVTIRPARAVRIGIRTLWDRLEEAGVPLGFDRALIEPHVTLAVVETDADGDAGHMPLSLEAWCRRFAAALPRFPLHFLTIGVFPGEQGSVLFLGVPAGGPLGEAYTAFHKGLPPDCHVTDEVYGSALWMPHVTLALGLDAAALESALRVAARVFRPMSSAAADLELYELFPVQQVLRIALGPCGCGLEKQACSHCEHIRFSQPLSS